MPVTSSDHHRDEDDDRLPCLEPERHGLAAHELAAGRPRGRPVARPSRRARPTGPGARSASPTACSSADVEVLAARAGSRPRPGRRLRDHAPRTPGSPMNGERGGIRTSARPVSRPNRPALGRRRHARPYWRASVRACRLRSAETVLGDADRQEPVAEQRDHERSCRASSGMPDERELEEAERRDAVLDGGVRRSSTFTFEPVSASCDPAWAPKHERDQQLRRRDRPRRVAVTTTTGSSAATARVDASRRRSAPATISIISTSSRARLVPAPVDELLAGPRRDARSRRGPR